MTNLTDLIWSGLEEADEKRTYVRRAIAASELTFARVQGMKLAAQLDPPRAAQGGFPYPARTCAEWKSRPSASPTPERGSRHKASAIRNAANARSRA